MANLVQDVMTRNPKVLRASSTVMDAASTMRDFDIGDVIVVDDTNKVHGIVTDRDLVVKAVASGSDPSKTSIGSVCTKDVTVLKPTQTTDDSVKIMREKAIRRLPVVASYVPTVAAGSIATVFGSNLSIGTASSAAANPLPFTLASSSFQTGAAELPPIP